MQLGQYDEVFLFYKIFWCLDMISGIQNTLFLKSLPRINF